MAIHVHATYKAGLIYPDQPLGLPENSKVDLTVVPVTPNGGAPQQKGPIAPRFSPSDLRAVLSRHAVSVGTLSADFWRADIYREHD